jgi:hypothetical protein
LAGSIFSFWLVEADYFLSYAGLTLICATY